MRRCYHCMHPIEQDKAQTCPQCGQSLAAQPVDSVFLRPGTILQGKYLVGYPLGSGGFGNTYIGWNHFLDRRVAIKEFYPKQIIGRTRDGRRVTMGTTKKKLLIKYRHFSRKTIRDIWLWNTSKGWMFGLR